MDLKKAENYLNKELGFVKNTLISYPEVIKAMAKYAESEAINYSQCCTTLKDLKGNEIQIKSLSDLKEKYPKGTKFSVAGNGKVLNYYVDGEIAYTRHL